MSFAQNDSFLIHRSRDQGYQLSCRKCPEKLQLYQADRAMPVRGLLATKLRFGIKLAALNFKKLSAYLDSLDQCALLSANS